jgi:hypothetical protein
MAAIQLSSVAHFNGSYPLYSPFQVDLAVVVGAGTNRMAVLMATSPASTVMTSADWNAPTFDGAAMTLLVRQSLGANVAHGVWYVAIADAVGPGTYTLRISSTTNLGGTSVYFTGLALEGVSAATPFGTVANYSNSGSPTSPINTSITVGAGGLALSMHGIYAPSAAGLALKAGASVLAAKATVAQREMIHAYEAAATQIGMTFTTSNQAAQLGIPVNSSDTFTGTITLDAFTLSGDMATGALSQLSSGITLDAFALSGFLGLAPGRIDSNPFKNWTGTLLPGVTIPRLTFLRLSDMSVVLQLTNQTTAGDGVLTVTNAAFTPGITYLVVAASVDGASLGAEIYTAT